MEQYSGQLAAIGAACFFAVNTTILARAGKQLGSVIAVRGAIALALIWVTILHTLTIALPDLSKVELYRLGYLFASGVVGFGFGAVFMTMALVRLGPRLSSLIVALSPVFSSIMAWIFFAEELEPSKYMGIALTLAGIAFVVTEKRPKAKDVALDIEPRDYFLGMLFAVLTAFFQSTVFVLNRVGAEGDFPALTGTLIRLLGGVIILWVVALLRREFISTIKTYAKSMSGMRLLLLSSILGPTIGVSLVIVAVQQAPVGIASALSNLTPIILVPISHFFLGERISIRAVIGTLIAVLGTIIIFV